VEHAEIQTEGEREGRPAVDSGAGSRDSKLHAKLTEIVGKTVAASADRPKTSEKLSNELRRLAPQLRMHGLNVNFERRHEGRIITLKSERVPIVPPEVGGKKPETS
jgi:hypothetical protein